MVTVIHGVLVEGTAVVEEETVVQLVLNVENNTMDHYYNITLCVMLLMCYVQIFL